MDSIVSSHFEKILTEYCRLNEARECTERMVAKLELSERDIVIEGLQKQILQLQQENKILEEANARYSKLQLVEAYECQKLQQTFLKELEEIQSELRRTHQLERDVDELRRRVAELGEEISQSQETVKEREKEIETMKKEIRVVRYAYMNVVAPLLNPFPNSLEQFSSSIHFHVFSYLDPISAEYFGSSHPLLRKRFEMVKTGRIPPPPPVDNSLLQLNETIATQRENISKLLEIQRKIRSEAKMLLAQVDSLYKTLADREKDLRRVKSDLQSAYNQMASDKEVKYYLDESYTRVCQEVKEKEGLLMQMKKEFAETMRVKEALLTENRHQLRVAMKGRSE